MRRKASELGQGHTRWPHKEFVFCPKVSEFKLVSTEAP